MKMRILIAAIAALGCVSASVVAQQPQFKQFDAVDVFRQMDSSVQEQPLFPSWWDTNVAQSLRDQPPIQADVHTLLYLAVHHSNQIKIAKRDPLIRETAIQEADSNFDCCLLYTSPSPRDRTRSRMPSSA